MRKNRKLRVLESIGKIYDVSSKCQLKESFFLSVDKELNYLSKYFRVSKSQSFFISIVIVLNYKGDTVDFKDLTNHFDCIPTKVLEFNDDINFLYENNYLKKEKSRRGFGVEGANDQFSINEKITEAILQNKSIPELRDKKPFTIIELLEKLNDLGDQRENDLITTSALFHIVKSLLNEYRHFLLIKKIKQLKLDTADTYLLLYLIWRTLNGSETLDVGRTVEMIYNRASIRVSYAQNFLSGNNQLIKQNLIEVINTSFFNDNDMKLTDKSDEILTESGINLFRNKKQAKGIIAPSDIEVKELIFSKEEMKQVFVLKDLLHDSKFKETQNRLQSKNLPKGITVLLHGTPGTGKTEIVKQIAKETGREIMKVEISQSKSMWFGESEKIIKKIFTNYKEFAKKSEKIPILFFNEADAIISKRKEHGNSAVAQTENAIQNILLEEIENFEGILIATTNLVEHIDKAFERRFLFKVLFEKPNIEIRSKIWKSKLPNLENSECDLLAINYDFSGGQIDNIVRKIEINEVLNENISTFDNIEEFCNQESYTKEETSKVGFKK